ncbi:cytochrome c biogenesis heme-transporting ATPase CcmA [Xylophilus sp.]|uniref:cytochrome c biogenesis heme-transporting ATPase CcmA n=1 Tax=Xylophilus sp. TaxID=2653893 RepID=UPI0013B9F867|nr:cytochrome c biogenesis heme-transporting ATPase CcmA [Xylophilus sp.]KAF1050155.1 MAG: Cytochrome c biogenesis ATP-binding export protein CcmA [Xylophilus sp.]
MPSPHDDGLRLAAAGVRCRRGGRNVLPLVDFDLRAGQVLELRGANGSGKTSLLRLLAGLTPASAGELHWNGRRLRPVDAGYAAQMAYLGHLNGLSPHLSAAENLRLGLRLSGGAPAEAVPAALATWGLAALAGQPVRRLSQGQRRRLALARVTLGQRALWLLDEPYAALDRASEDLLDAQLTAHLEHGGAAVIATHRPLGVPATMLRTLQLDALPQPSPAAPPPEDVEAFAC